VPLFPENIHIPPPPQQQKGLEIPGWGWGGVSKAQKFRATYEAKLELPEAWGCS